MQGPTHKEHGNNKYKQASFLPDFIFSTMEQHLKVTIVMLLPYSEVGIPADQKQLKLPSLFAA